MHDRTNWLTIFLLLFSICFRVLESTSAWAADSNVWQTSINLQTKERYIPVELWTGADWDGTKELRMAPIDGTYRHRTSTYYIKGPTDWKHPVTAQISRVYERINPDKNRNEAKTQLFTINQDQTGLGRLFDGRPGRDTRTYSGGLKFPLGLWKEGESKSFTYKVWDTSETERVETITIQRFDFSYQSTAHCLEIYWIATDRSGRKTYDRHTYIYCPGKSMVSQIQH